MGFSSDYWYSFHYSDSRGYLIFCCHGVAKILRCLQQGKAQYKYITPLITRQENNLSIDLLFRFY